MTYIPKRCYSPDPHGLCHLDAALLGIPLDEYRRLKVIGLSRALNASFGRERELEARIRELEGVNA